MQPSFGIGDKSVYPAHGVADVVGLENKNVAAPILDCFERMSRAIRG